MEKSDSHLFTKLEELKTGDKIVVGGQVATVSPELAESYCAGDRLVGLPDLQEILHIPQSEIKLVESCIDRATKAFLQLGQVSESAILSFYNHFASYLQDEQCWAAIADANRQDVAEARKRGRSVTRLIADEKLRQGMIEGLSAWAEVKSKVGEVLESVDHGSWRTDLVGAPLGIVAFVFEGRPNVLADATGVLRNGNVSVLRIGGDALATAKAIADVALRPALRDAGLPQDSVVLIESRAHAAAWALFSDSRVSLAVARGSGRSVHVLGAVAQQAGVPVSLHGTGGAWLFVSSEANRDRVTEVVASSLDRKVCNTLNTCVVYGESVELHLHVHSVIEGLRQAAEARGATFKLHVCEGSEGYVPEHLFTQRVSISRSGGEAAEMQAVPIMQSELGKEWEWEESPEMTVVVVPSLKQGVDLFNLYSPQFVACLLNTDDEEFSYFYSAINAPFVGDGFTRWVDGQYALRTPELGLSNWEYGRLLARPAVLSGSTIYSVRARVTGTRYTTPSR